MLPKFGGSGVSGVERESVRKRRDGVVSEI